MDEDLGLHLAALANAVAAFIEINETGPLLDAATATAAVTVDSAAEAGHSDDIATLRAVVAMFHSCRQEVEAHDDMASTPPDPVWPLLVLDAAVSDQTPDGLRRLAFAVAEAVTIERQARAAMRAVTSAIFQDDVDVLDAAIATLITAAGAVELSPRMRLRCQNKLASGYWQRFDVARDPLDLDRALAISELVIADAEEPELIEAKITRASLLLERFRITGAAEDLVSLERLCAASAESTVPLDHLTREFVLILRNARLQQFESTNDPVWLDAVIELGERAVRNSRDTESPMLLALHAKAYVMRHELTDSAEDLDKAIEYYRHSHVEAVDPPWEGGVAVALWDLLSERLRIRPSIQDRDELIDLSLTLAPSFDGELRTDVEHRRAHLLWDRFSETLSLEDLNAAIEAAQMLADRSDARLTSGDLSNLCYMLQVRYRRTNNLDDIDASVAYGRRATSLSHGDVADEARHLSNLFASLALRSDADREANAHHEARLLLDEAVRVAERATQLFAPDDPNGASHWNNLAVALFGRFQVGGTPEDLDRSIDYAQLGLAADPGEEAAVSLGPTLLAALSLRLDRMRDDSTLDPITELIKRGVSTAPAWVDSLGNLLGLLNHLIGDGMPTGNTLIEAAHLAKFRQTRDGVLLAYEQCLVFMSWEVVDAGSKMRNLELVERAIGMLDHAISLSDESRSAMLIGTRGEFLIRRWQLTLARADLDDAIASLIRSADLDSADDGHPSVMAALHRRSAATALMRRFRRRRNAVDLDEAERLLLLAEPVFAELEPDALPELTAMLASIRNGRERPPLVISQMDVLEVGREDLTSPYAMANVQAWNRGEPRRSGLTWVHTDDRERGVQPSKSVP